MIIKKIKKILNNPKRIKDKILIKKFLSNESFPFLVSFPRTGSHWLRMMMELYFEKPTLVIPFYYKNSKDFICYHTHDLELKVQSKNVIYLYRDPTDAIYSQMKYYNDSLSNKTRIKYWATLYGLHLEKWLIEDDFTDKKIIIKYEKLKDDIDNEFIKICDFFGEYFNKSKLEEVFSKISKEEVKNKTKHDKKVINNNSNYDILRKKFRKENKNLIEGVIYSINPEIKKIFK